MWSCLSFRLSKNYRNWSITWSITRALYPSLLDELPHHLWIEGLASRHFPFYELIGGFYRNDIRSKIFYKKICLPVSLLELAVDSKQMLYIRQNFLHLKISVPVLKNQLKGNNWIFKFVLVCSNYTKIKFGMWCEMLLKKINKIRCAIDTP